MNKIIFDIETVGVDFEKLDKASQEYLMKYSETPEERAEMKDRLSLWPTTAEIVAVAVLNPDTEKGAVYFQSGNEKIEPFSENGIDFRAGSEEDIIKWFWKAVARYDQFITFNGRAFDAPFLILRSAVHKITPEKNLMPPRYSNYTHIDLMDQLSFYGAMRRFSLDFYSKCFGIKSPKDGGIDGSCIAKLYKDGEYLNIARYCMGDVFATKKLYEVWRDYININ